MRKEKNTGRRPSPSHLTAYFDLSSSKRCQMGLLRKRRSPRFGDARDMVSSVTSTSYARNDANIKSISSISVSSTQSANRSLEYAYKITLAFFPWQAFRQIIIRMGNETEIVSFSIPFLPYYWTWRISDWCMIIIFIVGFPTNILREAVFRIHQVATVGSK